MIVVLVSQVFFFFFLLIRNCSPVPENATNPDSVSSCKNKQGCLSNILYIMQVKHRLASPLSKEHGKLWCNLLHMCKSNFNPLIWTMDLYVQWLGNVHREYHSQTLSTDTSFLDARYIHLIPRSSVQIPYSQTLRKDTSFPDPWYTYLIPRPLAIYTPHSKD